MEGRIQNIIFDLGAVLIDWNPRYLYQQIFQSNEAIDHFLKHVCTSEWNEEQDGGRPIREAEALLLEKHPHYRHEILAFYGRWTEMLGGPIQGTVDVLQRLKENKQQGLYALTNWSAETWPRAVERFDFLSWFDGILVSGKENMKKPDLKIYHTICDRYGLDPSTTLFIDDNLRNIEAAQQIGLQTIHFVSASRLESELNNILGH